MFNAGLGAPRDAYIETGTEHIDAAPTTVMAVDLARLLFTRTTAATTTTGDSCGLDSIENPNSRGLKNASYGRPEN